MRIHPAKQGTPDWKQARVGLPTASNFDMLITSKGKPSAQADKYLVRLVTEWFTGQPTDQYISPLMERGSEMEKQAVAWYEFDADADTTECGLCLRDDGKVGCSPDRLIGDDGGLEIKCPGAETQMGYVLDGVTDEYRTQIQGCLLVTGRKWWDLVLFNPVLPKVRVRFERDEPFLAALSSIVDGFVERLDAAKARLVDKKREADDARMRETGEVPAELVSWPDTCPRPPSGAEGQRGGRPLERLQPARTSDGPLRPPREREARIERR